jgi:hypothetical protein
MYFARMPPLKEIKFLKPKKYFVELVQVSIMKKHLEVVH